MDRGIRLVLPAALALLLAAAPATAGRTYKKGDPVVFSGRVRDAAGQPLTDVTVLLQVSRQAFKLKKLGREKGDSFQVPARVDERGSYRIDWTWDSYYNTFELVVAYPVIRGGGKTYHVFHQVDLTGNVLQGSPVVFPLVVEDTTDLERLRAFFASLRSDDEKRIYEEMGLPDRIDRGEADYDPDLSWWYFSAGKVYRFDEGILSQVTHFPPVEESGS